MRLTLRPGRTRDGKSDMIRTNVQGQGLRLLLVDDHPLVRDGLRAAIRHDLPGATVEEVESGSAALSKMVSYRPIVVLLDVNLPGISGLETLRQIKSRDRLVRVLMVAAEADPWTVREAVDAGASGFVSKTRSAGCLGDALSAVLAGQQYLCEHSSAALERASECADSARGLPGPAVLSSREREVLRCLAHGENTKSIAGLLNVSPKTVETHRQHITRKLGTNSVAALARYALKHGLSTL